MVKKHIHILYISQYFPPEMGAPSARVFELSRRWIERGAEVTVLTAFPNHPTGVIPPEYLGKKYLEEKKDGIKVIRTYIYAAPNKGFLRRSLSYFSFLCSAIIQGTAKVGKPDIIIATSPQFFVGIAGYIISRFKKIPFVFEVRDLWPESIVQLGLLKNKMIIRFLEYIELILYKKSKHIIGVADSTIEVLRSRGISHNKISIIKNGVDLNLFRNSISREEAKIKHHLEGKFIVSYIGTLGLSHALDTVLESAKLLMDNTDIIFLLVGEGAEKETLKEQARKANLQNVIFQDQIEKQQLPEYYSLSDLILVTLRALPLFKKVIPSKLFEIMAMEKPIVLGVNGEARKLVEKADAGIFVQPENASDLANKIMYLKQYPKHSQKLGQNGLNYVRKHFDRNKLADDYLEILAEIVASI